MGHVVSFYAEPFKNFSQAEDTLKYCVQDRIVDMTRWFQEMGGPVPRVSAVHDGPFIRINGQACASRLEVAEVLNWHWQNFAAAAGLTVLGDELVAPTLSVSSAQIEPCDEPLVQVALAEGQSNFWIRKAWDPPFNRKSFAKVRSLSALEAVFRHGNWSLGSAWIYSKLAFIQQVDGGDEWLVVRADVGSFESWSAGSALKRDPNEVKRFVDDCLAATQAQLQCLEYRDARLAA